VQEIHHERTRHIVGAVTVDKIGHSAQRMLDDSDPVGDRFKMAPADWIEWRSVRH
jgi:hypothetical protein